MKENIDDIIQNLKRISSSIAAKDLRIIDKTESLLKARIYFMEDLFVQLYINIRNPKRSYTLILNEKRIFGKDYIFSSWHLHPYTNPEFHDDSKHGQKEITIEDFVEESLYIVTEKLKFL